MLIIQLEDHIQKEYVEVNYKKAFYYLSKGYLALDTNCIESLAEMYLKGLHVRKDVYTALELYNKAIEFEIKVYTLSLEKYMKMRV